MKLININFKIVVLYIISMFLLTVSLPGQNLKSLISEENFRALNNEISGEIAQDYIRYITHFDRLQPSKSYHESAEWVVEAAKRAGLSDAYIEEYPSDGKKRYYMFDTELAWDVDFAELWIVEPFEEKLTSYAEIPMSIAITSDQCDVTAEMIYVGVGTSADDYEGINVEGKIVFAEGSIGTVARIAVDTYGAVGVVAVNQRNTYYDPDIVSSIRVTTKNPAFGFGLSHRRGEELKNRFLRGEEITARAVVRSKSHVFPLENVVATIPGTDLSAEEILLTAHLCHLKPGANDNASGSACLLEIGQLCRD